MNRRAIMEKVIYQEYEARLIAAASKINNGWREETIQHEIEAAEKKLTADLEALDRIMRSIEGS